MKLSVMGALVALTLSLAAGSASASDFCVGASDLCLPAKTYPMTATGMQQAVDDASSVANSAGPDNIFVAAGTIELGEAEINVDPATGEDVTIEGGGPGKTIFHSTAPDEQAFTLMALNADVSFSNATIQMDGAQSTTRRAIKANGVEIGQVKFELTGAGGITTEGFEGSGVCRDCEFALSGNNAEAGYALGNMTLHRANVYATGSPTGTTGFRQGGAGNLQLFSSTISNVATGMSTDNGTLILSDSVIDMGDTAGARGMVADNSNNGTQTIGAYAYNATIVGTGDNQRSITGDANAGQSLNLYAKNSILMASASSSKDLVCTEAATGSANLTIDFDLYYASHFTFDPNCSTSTTSPQSADPYVFGDIFVDAGGGDFRLRKPDIGDINPAFDAGNSNTPCNQAIDLLGNTRCVNSLTLIPEDGKVDLGAVEYQNYRPDDPVITASSGGRVGDALTFSAEGFDANGDPLTFSWKFGDSQSGSGASLTHTYSEPGTYAVKVKSDDGVSQSDEVGVTVTIAPLPLVETPALTTLVLAKASGRFKFKKGARLYNGFKAAAKKPKTAFVLATASAAISGKITILSSKGKALKGSQRISLKPGKSYLTFGGKWNKKALAKGRYTLKFSSSSLKDAPKAVLNVVR